MPGKFISSGARWINVTDGDVVAGVLLRDIAYWMTKASHEIDGYRYAYDIRERWTQDAFGYFVSDRMIDGVTDRLIADGLIEKRVGLHPTRKGRCTFLRITEKGQAIFDGQSGRFLHGQVKEDYIRKCREATHTPYITEGNLQEGSAAECMSPLEESKMTMTVKETLALAAAKKKEPIPADVKLTASKVYDLWVEFHTDVYPGIYVEPWTQKVTGQISLMLEKVPQSECRPALEYAIRHWDAFALYAEETTSAFDLPSMPDILIVTRFAGAMINFWRSSLKSATEGDDSHSSGILLSDVYKKK